jgi:hypothetical protein
MHLYILDSQFRRIEVFDEFESLIWTERFCAYGDFEFVIHASWVNRQLLTKGTFLGILESKRVMVIETVIDKDADDGTNLLTVTGKSLEFILNERIAYPEFDALEITPRWAVHGTPGQAARQMFREICIDGRLDLRDRIPYITEGSIQPADNIVEPSGIKRFEFDVDTLYNTIQKLCSENDLGFSLLRNGDNGQLYFHIYAGSNRTTGMPVLTDGTVRSPVVFSPEHDTLSNVSHMVSDGNYKNVAYVFSPTRSILTYANDLNHDHITGFDRRVLMVKVDNVREFTTEQGLTTDEILRRRGIEALMEHRRISMLDGQISKTAYQYDEDYNLGDIVEMRKDNDATSYMRVTEQIFVSDSEGDRAYPTLSIESF